MRIWRKFMVLKRSREKRCRTPVGESASAGHPRASFWNLRSRRYAQTLVAIISGRLRIRPAKGFWRVNARGSRHVVAFLGDLGQIVVNLEWRDLLVGRHRELKKGYLGPARGVSFYLIYLCMAGIARLHARRSAIDTDRLDAVTLGQGVSAK